MYASSGAGELREVLVRQQWNFSPSGTTEEVEALQAGSGGRDGNGVADRSGPQP